MSELKVVGKIKNADTKVTYIQSKNRTYQRPALMKAYRLKTKSFQEYGPINVQFQQADNFE